MTPRPAALPRRPSKSPREGLAREGSEESPAMLTTLGLGRSILGPVPAGGPYHVNDLLVFALTLSLLASSPTFGPRLAASGFGAVAPSSQGGSGAGKQEDAGSASKGTTPSDAGGAGKARSAQSQSDIDWYPFANAAFLRAQALNRPILLVVSMQWNRDAVHFVNEVLTRPEVVSIIRSRFIPILVNPDLRPDIRQRYPGVPWPSMTILNPEGDPLYVPAGEASKPHRMTLELVKPEKLAAFL